MRLYPPNSMWTIGYAGMMRAAEDNGAVAEPSQPAAEHTAHVDDHDLVREWEARDEQARWDEAQDAALDLPDYDHREDVP